MSEKKSIILDVGSRPVDFVVKRQDGIVSGRLGVVLYKSLRMCVCEIEEAVKHTTAPALICTVGLGAIRVGELLAWLAFCTEGERK